VVADRRTRVVPAGLGRWLEAAAPRGVRGEASVAIVGDIRMRQLNRRFRGVDRVTDVLAFPAGPQPGRESGPLPSPPPLGDIVIAAGRARRQARAARHSLTVELRVLALHGLLHLLGYDHERDHGQMARLERRLRRKNGLETGLIERHRWR
jgi:probable rRNA maturation factor